MHVVRIDYVHKQCAELLYTYNLYNGENEVGPDSRHLPYITVEPLLYDHPQNHIGVVV